MTRGETTEKILAIDHLRFVIALECQYNLSETILLVLFKDNMFHISDVFHISIGYCLHKSSNLPANVTLSCS